MPFLKKLSFSPDIKLILSYDEWLWLSEMISNFPLPANDPNGNPMTPDQIDTIDRLKEMAEKNFV